MYVVLYRYFLIIFFVILFALFWARPGAVPVLGGFGWFLLFGILLCFFLDVFGYLLTVLQWCWVLCVCLCFILI